MPSALKKILSYLVELPVEKRQSRLSGQVSVSLHRGQYKLSTNNAIYSFGKNYTSFSKAFEAVGIHDRKIGKVLVLGFGLGSVVDLLEKNTSVETITAVDADEVILGLAKKYLGSALKDKIEFICTDAEEFVRTSQKSYDLVLFDIFIGDQTPVNFIREEFLQQLKKLVSADGMLLYSKIEISRANEIENQQFQKIAAIVFPGSFSIDTDGNKVYAWLNQ